MPKLKVNDIHTNYEQTGSGEPFLLIPANGWKETAQSKQNVVETANNDQPMKGTHTCVIC